MSEQERKEKARQYRKAYQARKREELHQIRIQYATVKGAEVKRIDLPNGYYLQKVRTWWKLMTPDDYSLDGAMSECMAVEFARAMNSGHYQGEAPDVGKLETEYVGKQTM